MEKRKRVYLSSPKELGIAPCKCGNVEVQWSEFCERLWCEKCQIDFEPEHWGILDGPVMAFTAMRMGYNFDMLDLETNKIHIFNPEGENELHDKVVTIEEYNKIYEKA